MSEISVLKYFQNSGTKFESYLFYFLIIFVSLIPFQYISIETNLFGFKINLFKAIPNILLLLLLTLIYFKKIHKRFTVPGKNISIIILIILIWNFLAVFSSSNINHSMARYFYYNLTGIAVTVISYFVLNNLRTIYKFLSVLVIVYIVVSLVGIVDNFMSESILYRTVFSEDNYLYQKFIEAGAYIQGTGRSLATFGHPNPLGFCLIPPVILVISFLTSELNTTRKIFFTISAIILLTGILLTFSRGSWIALSVGLIYFFTRFKGSKDFRSLRYLGFVFLVLIVVGFSFRQTISDRLAVNNSNLQQTNRVYSYLTVQKIIESSPIFGLGTANFRIKRFDYDETTTGTIDSPDNMYLMTLAENGFIGLILFAYLLKSVLGASKIKRINSDTRVYAIYLALQSIFVAFLINFLTFDALYHPVPRIMFWSILGIMASLAYRTDEELTQNA